MRPRFDVRRGGGRFSTRTGWLDSRHSFSFGEHYDPANTGHGLLLVNNDDVVRPGTGFMTHPHRDMEIVTWVVRGELEHKDSEGHRGVIVPGLAQRMSAGAGIWHSEINPSRTKDVRFIQMWVPPDETGLRPGYQQLDISRELDRGGLVAVASGRGDDSAIAIRQRNAVLWAARLPAGYTVKLPEAPYAHVFVVDGAVDLEGAGRLAAGDAARAAGAGGARLTAAEKSEVLVWEFQGELTKRHG